jgi:hypothetical protein
MRGRDGIIILTALFSSFGFYFFVNHSILLHINLIFLDKPGLFFIFIVVSTLISFFLFKQREATLMLLLITAVMIIYYNLNAYREFPRLELVIPSITFYQLSVLVLGITVILTMGYLFSLSLLPSLSAFERFLVALGLGLGINMILLLLLGVFMKLTIANILIVQLFTTFLFAIFNILKRKDKLLYPNLSFDIKNVINKPNTNVVEIVFLIITISYICFTLYPLISTPVTEWDSLAYGINYAKVIFESSGIPLVAGPSIGKETSFNYPPGHQVLAAFFFILAGEVDDFYYRFLASIVIMAIALAVYQLSVTLTGSRYQSLLAIIITLNMFNFIRQIAGENYITYTTLFVTLSLIYILKALRLNPEDRNINYFEIAATLFSGFAGLTSYIGMSALGVIIIYSIFKKRLIKRVVFLILVFFLITSPWYLRNLFLLGNPIYPIFSIGRYLDPVLHASTSQHFRAYLNLLVEDQFAIAIKWGFWVMMCLLSPLTVLLLTKLDIKDRLLLFISNYFSMVILAIFLLHAPFPRYLMLTFPLLSVLLVRVFTSMLHSRNRKEKIVSIMLLASLVSLLTPAIAFNKPVFKFEDEMDYVIRYYAEADTWKWINDNTEDDAVIATFDIREYYINRRVMLLDGYDAVPLYRVKSISEALEYLRQRGVRYILSIPWVSPQSPIRPPAYDQLIITRYLGSPLLPPVYVSPSGATIYSVKPVGNEEAYEFFREKNLIPPLKELKLNITISNVTRPPTGRVYIAIPCDYVKGQMHVWVASPSKQVSVELWKGLIDLDATEWWKRFEMKARGPPLSIGLGARNPGFVWSIDSGGYYTLMVVAWEKSNLPFNVTIYIEFYTKWEVEEMFLNLGKRVLNLSIDNYHTSPMKVVYLNIEKPSVLKVKAQSFSRRVSLEVYMGLIPRNAVTNWWMWSVMIERMPVSSDGFSTKDLTINSLFLLPGYYSLLVVYWDAQDLGNLGVLEIELVRLDENNI